MAEHEPRWAQRVLLVGSGRKRLVIEYEMTRSLNRLAPAEAIEQLTAALSLAHRARAIEQVMEVAAISGVATAFIEAALANLPEQWFWPSAAFADD